MRSMMMKLLMFSTVLLTLMIGCDKKQDTAQQPKDERHYVNSKRACDDAMKIIIKAGDIARLSSDDKIKVADLLGLAISEANLVNPTYLQNVHPQLPEKYQKNYKYAIGLLVEGFRTDDTPLVLAGAYGYNEFAEWMKAHEKELSF
jgi:hypothetical protein